MVIKPRTYVQAPAFTPLPFGLLSTLQSDIRSPANLHWQAGVTYESLCANSSTTYDECIAVTGTGSPPPSSPKTATTELTQRGATAFTVYTEIDCSAPGFWDRAQELANQSLTQSEQWQVERAFWTGIANGRQVVFPHLAANTEVLDDAGVLLQPTPIMPVTGAAVDLVTGIGRLEAAAADCYDGVAVIHVPRALAPAMNDANLLIRNGSRYYTPNGNIVVLGSGYPGTSPSGESGTNTHWVYATGAMMIYRGEAQILSPQSSTLDRNTNTVSAIVERTYLLSWDCCHVAVQVTGQVQQNGGGGLQPTDISATAPATWDSSTNTIGVNQSQINIGSTSGTLAIARGGTGATSASAALTALGGIPTAQKGAANGVASLGADGLVPTAQLPADAVMSVAGKTGVVTLVKGDVGLGSVDNTADTAKPVSTAQQTAINNAAGFTTQTLTPTDGGTSAITAFTVAKKLVILNHAATIAATTVQLPPSPVNGQLVEMSFAKAVTALTVTPSGGATVVGSITGVGDGGYAAYRYNSTVWYQVAG